MQKQGLSKVRYLVTMAMLCAVVLLMTMTPLGTLPIGPLSISFCMIPVAIGAITMGSVGGMIVGGFFGLLSYAQCYGIGVLSGMGAELVAIDPFLAFVQRFVPRLLSGLLCGLVHKVVKYSFNTTLACFMAGFCAALFNTVLFMFALILFFGTSDYIMNLVNGRNIFVFICTFVGINAVVEMVVDTLIVGTIGKIIVKVRGE